MKGTITSSSSKANGTLQVSLTNADDTTGICHWVYHNGTNGVTWVWLGAKNKFCSHKYRGLLSLVEYGGKSVLLNDRVEENTGDWNYTALSRHREGFMRIKLGA